MSEIYKTPIGFYFFCSPSLWEATKKEHRLTDQQMSDAGWVLNKPLKTK